MFMARCGSWARPSFQRYDLETHLPYHDELRQQVNDLFLRAAIADGFDSLQAALNDIH